MNITIWSFMDRMGFEMFHYLLSVFWQSTLLFAAVLIVLFFLRNHRGTSQLCPAADPAGRESPETSHER